MKEQGRFSKHTLKFISLLISFLIWVYVVSSEKILLEKSVTLDYIVPNEFILTNKPPTQVTFFIQGPRFLKEKLTQHDDQLFIDINKKFDQKNYDFFIDIDPTQLNLPFGMMVKRIHPKRVRIRIEKKLTKILPLKIQYKGKMHKNLSLEAASLEPSSIEVFGPRSFLNNINHLSVPVELDQLLQGGDVFVKVDLYDGKLQLETPKDIKLDYKIKAIASNAVLDDIPINVFSKSSQVITPSVATARLKIFIPEILMKDKENLTSSIRVWSDVPASLKGRIELPLKVSLPPGMHLLEIMPKRIVVNVQ